MATPDYILIPVDERPTKLTALGAAASSAEILLGKNRIFSVIATGNCHLRFGVAGMAAADANDHFIAASTKEVYAMPRNSSHIRIFNPTGLGIDVYIGQYTF